MAGGMKHVDLNAARANAVAVVQAAVELDDARNVVLANPARLHLQAVIERHVRRMQQAGCARAFPQRSEIADVVDVRVRMHEVFRARVQASETLHYFRDAVSAVDDDRFIGLIVAEDRAVAGEWTDRKRFDDQSMRIPKS